MNPALRAARFRFLAAIIVLSVLDIAAVAFLLSPSGKGREAWQQRRNDVQQELKEKRRDTAPLTNIESRLKRSQRDAAALIASRFAEDQSLVSTTLTEIAADEKVQIDRVTYKEDGTEIPAVDALMIETSVTGDYDHIVRFINALERRRTMFVIESLSLNGLEHGSVRVGLQLQTFLRRRSG